MMQKVKRAMSGYSPLFAGNAQYRTVNELPVVPVLNRILVLLGSVL